MSTIPPAGQDPLNSEDAFLPAQQQSPPATDPLVPANFAGWVERVLGVVRRSFAQLAVLQVIVAAVGMVVSVVMAVMAPDFARARRPVAVGHTADSRPDLRLRHDLGDQHHRYAGHGRAQRIRLFCFAVCGDS